MKISILQFSKQNQVKAHDHHSKHFYKSRL